MHIHVELDTVAEFAAVCAIIRDKPLDAAALKRLTEQLNASADQLQSAEDNVAQQAP